MWGSDPTPSTTIRARALRSDDNQVSGELAFAKSDHSCCHGRFDGQAIDADPGSATLAAMAAKTVLCIRHGESTFNLAWRENPIDPLHWDAPLSATGLEQVQRARATLAAVPVELVITSPLTRALQTAMGLFAEHPQAPPMLVAPLARERVENSCDVGRSPAQLAFDFPTLDLAHLPDVWWHAEGEPDARGICIEPHEAVAARAAEFRTLLIARPERVIAVVGHGTFLFHLTGRFLANCEATELDLGPRGLSLASVGG